MIPELFHIFFPKVKEISLYVVMDGSEPPYPIQGPDEKRLCLCYHSAGMLTRQKWNNSSGYSPHVCLVGSVMKLKLFSVQGCDLRCLEFQWYFIKYVYIIYIVVLFRDCFYSHGHFSSGGLDHFRHWSAFLKTVACDLARSWGSSSSCAHFGMCCTWIRCIANSVRLDHVMYTAERDSLNWLWSASVKVVFYRMDGWVSCLQGTGLCDVQFL